MVRLWGQNWTRTELLRHIGRIEQIGGVRLLEAADGVERGVRVLQVRTGGGLVFDVLGDRALDISTASVAGIPLAWSSASGDVHPAYYEPESTGWLRSFPGGLLATCGLDQFGAPGRDQVEEYGQHGRIGNLPGSNLQYGGRWLDDEYEWRISGDVRQTRTFGENLVLRRTIAGRLGSNDIHLRDTVTNEGYVPWPHMMLYHFNLGFPLINPETTLAIPATDTMPRDAVAAHGLDNWADFGPPQTNFREQVFRHDPTPDHEGWCAITIASPPAEIALTIKFRPEQLPRLFQWKMFGEGVYVLGIEPANSNGIEGRASARQRDDLPHLAPGQRRQYDLEIAVQTGVR